MATVRTSWATGTVSEVLLGFVERVRVSKAALERGVLGGRPGATEGDEGGAGAVKESLWARARRKGGQGTARDFHQGAQRCHTKRRSDAAKWTRTEK